MKLPNLSELAVRQSSITLFLMIAITLAGLIAFIRLGRAEDPGYTVKALTVTVAWPGATAREMQDQVADPLERRLQELRYYDRVDTQSRPGLVYMTLTLKDTMPPAEVPEQFYQARKKLTDEAARLPRGVIGPFIDDEYSDIYFSLYAVQSAQRSERDLFPIVDGLRNQLLRVPGVMKVRILGEHPRRTFVDVSYRRLATLGIAPELLLDTLAAQNLLSPAGEVETPYRSVPIRTSGAFDDIEALRNTPVAANGRVLTIKDIANVYEGYQDPATFSIRHNGQDALMLGVVMRDHYNGLTLGKDLRTSVASIQSTLPADVQMTQVTDQSLNIREAYGEFMIKFAVALAVVMVVSLLMLGLRVGLVVAAAVPLTLATVFVIMLATGRNFDRITLGALILSLGLLVDDAIISIEMMVVKMAEGMERIKAATYAWGATAAPMLAGTVITIVGFLPVGFSLSSAGEYAGNIFWVVCFSLLVSWLVAVYFVPYLGVRLLPAVLPGGGGRRDLYDTPVYVRLRRLIRWCVSNYRTVVTITALLLASSVMLLVLVIPKQFFPSSNRSEVLVEVALPEGSSIEATARVVQELESDLRGMPDAGLVDSYVGAGAPRFFLSLNPELPDPSFARLVILTADAAARDRLSEHLKALIAKGRYAEARVRVSHLVFGPPVPYPVSFRLSGPDLDKVRDLAASTAKVMRSNAKIVDVNTDWGERAPSLRLEFDQQRLHAMGLDPAAVARRVNALISGVTVSQTRIGNRLSDVVVRSLPGERRNLQDLGSLVIAGSGDRTVTLGGVARLEPVMEDPVLVRRDREPTITVRADVTPDVQPPDITAQIQRALEHDLALPAGYRIEAGGAAEESAKANSALVPVFPVMIGMMLLTLILQTRSFRLMLLTFATAPLGFIGAIPALLLTGQSFGFNAILGLIGLAGILMRNTLILVDQADVERRKGAAYREATIEATIHRSRPVMLTALAAVLAFLPLCFSTFWGPLAVVLIGGTIVGTALTLFFLPALFTWFEPRNPPRDAAPAADLIGLAPEAG